MGLLDFLFGDDNTSSNGNNDFDRSVFDSDRLKVPGTGGKLIENPSNVAIRLD